VDFLDPRKLHFPELDHEITFPRISENETLVLLNVATIKQIPEDMFLLPFALRTLTCSILAPRRSAAVSSFFSFTALPETWSFSAEGVTSFTSATSLSPLAGTATCSSSFFVFAHMLKYILV